MRHVLSTSQVDVALSASCSSWRVAYATGERKDQKPPQASLSIFCTSLRLIGGGRLKRIPGREMQRLLPRSFHRRNRGIVERDGGERVSVRRFVGLKESRREPGVDVCYLFLHFVKSAQSPLIVHRARTQRA